MLRLAGAIADGVLLNYLPASRVPWCVERVREGGDAEVYAYVHCGVTDRDRYADLGPQGSPELRGGRRVRRTSSRAAGFADDVEAFRAHWKARERDAALAAIGDAWVDEIQIMGDAAHVRAKVDAYDRGGRAADRVRAALGRRPPGDDQRDPAGARVTVVSVGACPTPRSA